MLMIFTLSAAPANSVTPLTEINNSDYDPLHTMLALNMAIVSIHKIVTTQDRFVLDQEYNTVINKLALGNIESDFELTGLFTEMMNFITGKALRQEEAKRFQERYNKREQRQLISALSGIRAYGGNLYSWLGSLATSCVSAYFSYQSSKAELTEGLDDDLWRLQKDDIEDCNALQVKLLNASWNLLRQYKLPDDYRLTQDSLDGFFKSLSEPEPAKRLRMLKARNVERNPPYWYYRAVAAQELKDDAEAARCFEKFEEIWRPVLRYDPYKLEDEKYRVQTLAAKENPDTEEIKKHLDIVRDYTPDGDWSNNLFAGVAYFLIGEKDEGIECVEPNVDFGYEVDVSKIFVDEMKAGKLDAFALFALQEDLKKALEKRQATIATSEQVSKDNAVKTQETPKPQNKKSVASMQLEDLIRLADSDPLAQFELGERYMRGRGGVQKDHQKAFEWYSKSAKQGNTDAMRLIGYMYYWGNYVEKDYKKAFEIWKPLADNGDARAQWFIGRLYYEGKHVEKNYKTAYAWFYLSQLCGYDSTEKIKDLEKDGWFSSPKVSKTEAELAKIEAQKMYDEIKKRKKNNGKME